MKKDDIHRCKESAGKAQTIVLLHQFIGDRGPLKWHLKAPGIAELVIFIIEYCPFCGKRPEQARAKRQTRGKKSHMPSLPSNSFDAAHAENIRK